MLGEEVLKNKDKNRVLMMLHVSEAQTLDPSQPVCLVVVGSICSVGWEGPVCCSYLFHKDSPR